jgi:hypothetical protein
MDNYRGFTVERGFYACLRINGLTLSACSKMVRPRHFWRRGWLLEPKYDGYRTVAKKERCERVTVPERHYEMQQRR